MTSRRLLFLIALGGLFSLASCANTGSGGGSGSTVEPIEITTSSGVRMVMLPGGEFLMGSSGGDADEAPRHTVRVSPLAIDKFEVGQDQYAAMELPDPSHFKGENRPVEQIRWSDAAMFCNERSRREGLTPCYNEATFECNFEAGGYRLPTEAEWEYVARAGADTDYDFGSSPMALKNYACYAGNARKKTDPVGQKKPNGWGLHDMYGNVSEWCQDVYGKTYYQDSPSDDPRGPKTGKKRVIRGGSWKSSEAGCRASIRQAGTPGTTDACFVRDTCGFRCVRRLSEDELKLVLPGESDGATEE
ncbi:MAG: formylglycine-generating enzyme family protein [Planctomycetes bacterium]|nr:formylglycine-generating enzyme family protein [Planctomycetota bacterium]